MELLRADFNRSSLRGRPRRDPQAPLYSRRIAPIGRIGSRLKSCGESGKAAQFVRNAYPAEARRAVSVALATIVEGYSEVESVPLLLRRIFAQLGIFDIEIARPFRVKRNRIVKAGEIERAIPQAIRDRAGVGGILVLIDAADDCPAVRGPQLLEAGSQLT